MYLSSMEMKKNRQTKEPSHKDNDSFSKNRKPLCHINMQSGKPPNAPKEENLEDRN